MVLIRRQNGDAYQREPRMEKRSRDAADMSSVKPPEDHEQRDVKGGRLVERSIDGRQRAKQHMGDAVRVWSREGELQRKQQKTRHRDNLSGQQASHEQVELCAGLAYEH